MIRKELRKILEARFRENSQGTKFISVRTRDGWRTLVVANAVGVMIFKRLNPNFVGNYVDSEEIVGKYFWFYKSTNPTILPH